MDMIAEHTSSVLVNRLVHFSESILTILPIGCAILASNGSCTYLNTAAQALLGCQPTSFTEIVFYHTETYHYPPDRLPFTQALQGQASHVEDVMIQRQGTAIFLAMQAVPLWDETKQLYQAIVTFQDITHQKQTELILRQTNHALERLAHLDGLTQIANRRHFDQHLQEHWQMMMRASRSLSLILCDIDYFKQYNDTYGHQVGDACLKIVAQTLQNTVQRSGDLVARYGGEEFAIILSNTNTKGAHKVAFKIQAAIAQLALPHRTSTASEQITLSLGIATVVPHRQTTPERLSIHADQALYQAKHNGRNQIASSPPKDPTRQYRQRRDDRAKFSRQSPGPALIGNAFGNALVENEGAEPRAVCPSDHPQRLSSSALS